MLRLICITGLALLCISLFVLATYTGFNPVVFAGSASCFFAFVCLVADWV